MDDVEESTIPNEWELRRDDSSGQAYYVNLLTGESTWDAPAEFALEEVADRPDAAIASATQWTEVADDDGRVYYMNLTTLETSWDPPQGFSAAASERVTPIRPSTAEQMDQLNVLLSGGDGEDEEEGGGGEEEEEEKEIEGQADYGNVQAVDAETVSSGVSDLVASIDTSTHRVAEDGSEWMLFLNKTDGLPYYYNHTTGECVWEPPAAFLAFHAQPSDGALSEGQTDPSMNVAQPSTPAAATVLSSYMPETPIQITPEFEEKVRRAIETVSKTPVGSSRLLFVRTPSLKSIDASRPTSRPTSSSGASARQRVATARSVGEEPVDASPPLEPEQSVNKEQDAQDFHVLHTEDTFRETVTVPVLVDLPPTDEDRDLPIAEDTVRESAIAPPLSALPPSDEKLELLQREVMKHDSMRYEMASTIQCRVRCNQARRRVARKRHERQQLSGFTNEVSKEIFYATALEEIDKHEIEGNGELLWTTLDSELTTGEPQESSRENPEPLQVDTLCGEEAAVDPEPRQENGEDEVSLCHNGEHGADRVNHVIETVVVKGDLEQPQVSARDSNEKELQAVLQPELSQGSGEEEIGRVQNGDNIEGDQATEAAVEDDKEQPAVVERDPNLETTQATVVSEIRQECADEEIGHLHESDRGDEEDGRADRALLQAVLVSDPDEENAQAPVRPERHEENREEISLTREGGQDDENIDQETGGAVADGDDQSELLREELSDLLAESEAVEIADQLGVRGIISQGETVEATTANSVPVAEKEGDSVTEADGASVSPTATDTVDLAHPQDHVTSDRDEAFQVSPNVTSVSAESLERPFTSRHDDPAVAICEEPHVTQPDTHHTNAAALPVLGASQVGAFSASDETSTKPPGEEIFIRSSPTRPTSSHQKSTSRRPDDRPLSRTTRKPASIPPQPTTANSTSLAVLNISTFFPPNPHRDRIKLMPSKPTRGSAAAFAGGIQRKVISTVDGDRCPTSIAPNTVEQRERERAIRAEGLQKVHDETKAQCTQEIEQCRQLFAAAAARSAQETRARQTAEEDRRQSAHDEQTKWRQDRPTARLPVDETCLPLWEIRRGDSVAQDVITRVQSARQLQGFVEAMMQQRLRGIHRMIDHFQKASTLSSAKNEQCAYWQQLVERFPTSLENGVEIEDPYWANLYRKFHTTATASPDLSPHLVRYRTDAFDSLFHAAAWHGHLQFVAFLCVELHADVHAIDCTVTKTTPLHEACRGGHLPVVKYLLSRGAFLDAVDAHGDTPLHVACRGAWIQVVHTLITAGHLQDESDIASRETGVEFEPPTEQVRVLQVLSWRDCFHLRNHKYRRAVDIATLPSLVEILTQYSMELQSHQHAVSSSADTVARHTKAVVKKNRTKPQRPKSATKSNPITTR